MAAGVQGRLALWASPEPVHKPMAVRALSCPKCLPPLHGGHLHDIDLVSQLPAQDRLTSGCSAVLMHLDFRSRTCLTASVGTCYAVAGQRVGGFNRATSNAKLLAAPPSFEHA